MTVPLLAEYLHKDKSTVYEQLLTLVGQELLTKNYDSSYRLPPKAATYCLAAKGIRYLRDTTELSRRALRNQYKNKAASEQLVEQCLKTFEFAIRLRRQYEDAFDILSKSDLCEEDDFIRPLPDLYLQNRSEQASAHNYMLELLEPSIASWLVRKRIRAHCEAADDVDYLYPHILFVVTNDSTEKRIQRMLENVVQDFEFWTTTTARLSSGETRIWREVFEDDADDKPLFKSLSLT